MRLERNLLVGLASSSWSALIGLAVVPLYLKYLGIESYGLIGFFATLQAVFQLLDMGMAPTINREVARSSATGDLSGARDLLHTLATIYWILALAIALVVLLLAPSIAKHWLQSDKLPYQTVCDAVILMGLVAAARWPVGLYQGALMGAQRLAVAGSINIAMVTFANAGAVLVLAFISPTVEAFFIWQAIAGMVYAVLMRRAAWLVVGRNQSVKFNKDVLKSVWRFSAGMSVVALSGVIFTQIDKIILSKILGLAEYGQYMLATLMVSGLYVLVTPFFNATYPKFSAFVAKGEISQLSKFYRLSTQLLAVFLFPLSMFLVLFSQDLVTVWTGNATLGVTLMPIVSLMVVGSALHGIMYIPYALQLAYGKTRLPIYITFALIVLMIPLIIFMTMTRGAIGAAMAWLVLHVTYLIIGTSVTHTYLLRGMGLRWILLDVGIPLVVTLLVGSGGYLVLKEMDVSIFTRLGYGVGLSIVAGLLAIVLCPILRFAILKRLSPADLNREH